MHVIYTKRRSRNNMNVESNEVTEAIIMALLSGQRKRILRVKRVELVQSIQLHGLWPRMRAENIVTESDDANIQPCNNTSFEQVGALLDHLAKRTDGDYEKFCKCLKEDNQGHIVTEILEDPSSIRKDIGDSHNIPSVLSNAHFWDKPRLLLNSVETRHIRYTYLDTYQDQVQFTLVPKR
ncbi:hypothetical protein CAPTEDRAFT_215568 [Capitella teleta]|uniref:CARD domain-containing protein n=1 Tax=Capitella teleta TaxID=283909 RepID=R7U8U7_CAPTE|nr:hypothetical protein CAPTEDRAFT_215568 [Capitella teleta]|eukprot:ELU02785.1 hypothetical protein CAPTEDRAFT_215568 [Capitella teleta]